MTARDVTEQDVAELIDRVGEATKAYIRGDMDTYFSLIRRGDDYLLMSPFGGEPERGANVSPERLEALRRSFRGGPAEVEVLQSVVSGDLVVLAGIERQCGHVGGLPEQVWSLRVTLV